MQQDLQLMTLDQVEAACHRETQRFRRDEPNDSRFCLEIFRRALQRLDSKSPGGGPMYANEDARNSLVTIYTGYIEAHISPTHPSTTPRADLVNEVWRRFWLRANSGLDFDSLPGALRFLKLTVVSTLIEDQRVRRKHWRSRSLEQWMETASQLALADSTAEPFSEHVRRRFRERCREIITDPLERDIFHMRESMGMPARDIARKLRRDGKTIQGKAATPALVSLVLSKIFQRLQQDPEIRELLGGD